MFINCIMSTSISSYTAFKSPFNDVQTYFLVITQINCSNITSKFEKSVIFVYRIFPENYILWLFILLLKSYIYFNINSIIVV